MIARGKCERSEHVAPGNEIKNCAQALKGRNIISAFQACIVFFGGLTRGDVLASLALAPGYHISRRWRYSCRSRYSFVPLALSVLLALFVPLALPAPPLRRYSYRNALNGSIRIARLAGK